MIWDLYKFASVFCAAATLLVQTLRPPQIMHQKQSIILKSVSTKGFIAWSSLVEYDEDSDLQNCQTILIIVYHKILSILITL